MGNLRQSMTNEEWQDLCRRVEKEELTCKETTSKQLEFSQPEQKQIEANILSISEILINKMDNGVEMPTLEGTLHIDKEDKKVVFSFVAQRK